MAKVVQPSFVGKTALEIRMRKGEIVVKDSCCEIRVRLGRLVISLHEITTWGGALEGYYERLGCVCEEYSFGGWGCGEM